MRKKVKISTYAKANNLHYRTVWNYCKQGLLPYEQTPTGTILILVEEAETLTASNEVAIYCRVSSSQNKSNLESQKQRLIDYCSAKGYRIKKIVCEVGSGLNDNRKKLNKILEDRTINIIVVEHKDRLARFGMRQIELLLAHEGRRIEVVNEALNDKEDLMQDFVSIITSFVARLYGQRRSKRKIEKIIAELKKSED